MSDHAIWKLYFIAVNLNIHNFRSFQNQDFNFSKVNILIGENSGGKSSLLKFLLPIISLKSNNDEKFKLYGPKPLVSDNNNTPSPLFKIIKIRQLITNAKRGYRLQTL